MNTSVKSRLCDLQLNDVETEDTIGRMSGEVDKEYLRTQIKNTFQREYNNIKCSDRTIKKRKCQVAIMIQSNNLVLTKSDKWNTIIVLD